MRRIFAGDVAGHRKTMRGLYLHGLIVAGLLNFMPDRTTNRWFFAETPELGWVVIAVGL